jgi:hypothetical protein
MLECDATPARCATVASDVLEPEAQLRRRAGRRARREEYVKLAGGAAVA